MLTRSAQLKQRIARGDVTVGAWHTLANLNVAEILALTGFDWVLIDTEHAPFDLESLQSSLSAFRSVDTVPLVRVAANDPVRIKHALDLGAEGIVVPQVETAADASRAIAATRYPPRGTRGFGPRRASNYYNDIDAYLDAADQSLLVVLQIESLNAVENIEAITAVNGIDVVFVGPMDLAASAGVLGQRDHPAVHTAIDRVLEHCRRIGMSVCTGIVQPGRAKAMASAGVTFQLAAFDDALLREGAKAALQSLRKGSS